MISNVNQNDDKPIRREEIVKCIHCGKYNHAMLNDVCHAYNAKGHLKRICLKTCIQSVNIMKANIPVMAP